MINKKAARKRGGETRGRPSLTGGAGKTPMIGLRLPPELTKKLDKIAAARNVKRSDVIRDAVEFYVKSSNRS